MAFALAPDLAVLYGIAPGLARGQLHPRAVPIYNALHQFWGPLALGGRAPGWHAGLVVARRERLVADSAGEPVATVAEVSPA